MIDQIMDKIGFPILVAVFITLYILETKYALRKRVQARFQRIITNGGLSVISFGLLRLAFLPFVVWIAIQNQQWHFGVNYLYHLPPAVEFVIGFLLLDYSNFLWHIVNHRVPLLWRFHNVHHTDLDLDVTTAIRFHFMEIVTSVIFRGGAVLLIGASPLLVLVYEIIFEGATNFHHSNWKLPLKVERALNLFFVTPRMHGIHHSIVHKETNSNFSVIFSFWDRLHHTVKLDIPQDDIIIGVPAYRNAHELTVWHLLKMPFEKQKPWQLPDGGQPIRVAENRMNKEETLEG